MKYFKVYRGYGEGEYIPIDETELEKAVYAHLSGKVVTFKNGSITGNNITMISPDYHRAMGWNEGYKLQPEDYADIRANCKDYNGLIADAKEKVLYLMQTNNLKMIGKSEAKEIDEPKWKMNGLEVSQRTAQVYLKAIEEKTEEIIDKTGKAHQVSKILKIENDKGEVLFERKNELEKE